MSIQKSYQQFLEGRDIATLEVAEAKQLADFVMRQHSDAYTNPRHADHAQVSEDVRRLHQVAAGPEGQLEVLPWSSI